MKDGGRKPFNYMAVVGIVFLIVIGFAIFNMLKTTDSGIVGFGEVDIGEKAEPFAVPVATSDLRGDANIDPDQACSVEGSDAIRICDFFGRPFVVSFWFTKGASGCLDQQDVFDEVATRYRGKAGFLSVNVRDDREKVREEIEDRGWKVEVGHDEDGAVSNLYKVGGCPTILFYDRNAVLTEALIEPTDAGELGAQVRSLINGQSQATQQKGTSEPNTGSTG
ncbi:MAG: TlpA family protein disulfide reductase [Solirubrobacterales bacterium]|nr:TlpA family protein disulfide reductase [Solirubrobacterales bacterium]